jgi:hypothetical protein
VHRRRERRHQVKELVVEGDFRQMKDPSVVSFSPMFHFTESKIRLHVFYCVLALMVAKLMVREANRAGMHMSVRGLLSSLAGIEETLLLYQGERGRPRARRMLTDSRRRRLSGPRQDPQRRGFGLTGLAGTWCVGDAVQRSLRATSPNG